MLNFHTNRLLESMSQESQARLGNRMERVDIRARARLEEGSRHVPYVYFVLSGLVSLVYRARDGDQVDVGVIGYEGCTGCSTILGCDRTPQSTTVQCAGEALRISVEDLHGCMAADPAMHGNLLRFVHTAILQRDETAYSASRANMHQRVARWLLMADDRMRGANIQLTHEILANMLGVRRAGVTTVMNDLHRDEMIDYSRKNIYVTGRGRLEKLAGHFYGASEAEFARLLPVSKQ
jgi:CRP-like cAMP-binding protein